MAMTMSRAAFFAEARPIFGGTLTTGQVDGINAILDAWERYGDGNPRHLAYLLATTRHETADTMQPIHERGKRAYFDKYEPGTKIGKRLGNTLKGDGFRFRGRGFVQLTGRRNYAKAAKSIGLDIVKEPDLALVPATAARILIVGCLDGWFTGKKLSDYPNDFVEARRVVNGTDRGVLIAGYAYRFLDAIKKATEPAQPQKPAPAPIAPPKPAPAPQQPPSEARGWLGIIIFAVTALGAAIAAGWGWLTNLLGF